MLKKDIHTEALSIFRVSKAYFAVPAKQVIEIVVSPQVTNVPQAASYMVGLFNHRGRILSLIDAADRLNAKKSTQQDQMLVMVIQYSDSQKELEFGIIVDEVVEILDIPTQEIQESPSLEFNFDASFVEGTIKHNGHHVTLLNIKNSFAIK